MSPLDLSRFVLWPVPTVLHMSLATNPSPVAYAAGYFVVGAQVLIVVALVGGLAHALVSFVVDSRRAEGHGRFPDMLERCRRLAAFESSIAKALVLGASVVSQPPRSENEIPHGWRGWVGAFLRVCWKMARVSIVIFSTLIPLVRTRRGVSIAWARLGIWIVVVCGVDQGLVQSAGDLGRRFVTYVHTPATDLAYISIAVAVTVIVVSRTTWPVRARRESAKEQEALTALEEFGSLCVDAARVMRQIAVAAESSFYTRLEQFVASESGGSLELVRSKQVIITPVERRVLSRPRSSPAAWPKLNAIEEISRAATPLYELIDAALSRGQMRRLLHGSELWRFCTISRPELWGHEIASLLGERAEQQFDRHRWRVPEEWLSRTGSAETALKLRDALPDAFVDSLPRIENGYRERQATLALEVARLELLGHRLIHRSSLGRGQRTVLALSGWR